jgi:hypothetical protein
MTAMVRPLRERPPAGDSCIGSTVCTHRLLLGKTVNTTEQNKFGGGRLIAARV